MATRTVSKAWTDDIFSESAAAAFWQTLSLPPLLLGLLGSLGFLGEWFGPDLASAVQSRLVSFSRTVFSRDVVNEIIDPTVTDILTQGRTQIVSVSFLLSLWAGSSALASLIDSITLAYGQYLVRNAIWQRTFALLLYLIALVMAVVLLPVIALGPGWLPTLFPRELQDNIAGLIRIFYYPTTGAVLVLALATVYKVSLPRKLPWHRGLPGALLAMLVFLCSSVILRLYITWVTGTGYTYGALATPIAFLLFAFFIGFAIIIGAYFNNAIQEVWPAGRTRWERRHWHRLEMQRIAQRLHTEEGAATWSSTPGHAWEGHRDTAPVPQTPDSPLPRSGGPSVPQPREKSPRQRRHERDEAVDDKGDQRGE
ncbi:membrane protein [Halopolyspora algeriensis]|uniref:Membrane protein n=1 Tax=Halopolyspora algeriensis TaxID=1500506 RepID=A0A368VS96_9ACTN|nr:membrane protein [Halopolyspora algeriensis]